MLTGITRWKGTWVEVVFLLLLLVVTIILGAPEVDSIYGRF